MNPVTGKTKSKRLKQPAAEGASGGDGSAIDAVDRAGRILFALAQKPDASGLIDVAHRTDLSKPTAFRILAALSAEGLVVQNPETGSYRLGVMPLRLASNVLKSLHVRDMVSGAMERIRDAVNETVVLSVRQGDWRYNVESAEAANAIGQTQRIGTPIPLYAGAASRVLLAAFEDHDLDDYVARTALVAHSKTTIADRATLMAEIARIRAVGYAVSIGEFTSGSVAIARVITDGNGTTHGALHVSIPRSRLTASLEARCIHALKVEIETLMPAIR